MEKNPGGRRAGATRICILEQCRSLNSHRGQHALTGALHGLSFMERIPNSPALGRTFPQTVVSWHRAARKLSIATRKAGTADGESGKGCDSAPGAAGKAVDASRAERGVAASAAAASTNIAHSMQSKPLTVGRAPSRTVFGLLCCLRSIAGICQPQDNRAIVPRHIARSGVIMLCWSKPLLSRGAAEDRKKKTLRGPKSRLRLVQTESALSQSMLV